MSENHRVDVADPSSGTYLGLISLNQEVSTIARQSGIPHGLTELLKIRVSQINGCVHALQHHSAEAVEAGEDRDRLAVLALWRRSGMFTSLERAALSLAEAITELPDQDVPAKVVREARMVLSHDQFVAVSWIAVMINSWNRISMISGRPVAS
ncbi:carboxymuconolactone decarboxylase family protein [Hoyosella sp. G463]|uniref:Carboxymuconolactone decarboxylase family protein n=1 Tax=Lolliginicoccus lacisalsi TaxID=2742202 RepID=A0A927JBJ5_9ACTN|nr:carboxymuconolactone decarboxylase family protein [Lolliginicoccus lacisalsi]MBD8506159.1 carboxymuconolactone decarboxylase family protein [Lolliginicoccus lacisalsi]